MVDTTNPERESKSPSLFRRMTPGFAYSFIASIASQGEAARGGKRECERVCVSMCKERKRESIRVGACETGREREMAIMLKTDNIITSHTRASV